MVVPYKHEPFTDYTLAENKTALEDALKQVEADLGGEYPLIINGERITTKNKITSVNLFFAVPRLILSITSPVL